MTEAIPYLVSPGSIKTALDRIKPAEQPPLFNYDFVESVLKMKGGSGKAVVSFLKKIGMVESSGAPSKIYNRFRNPSTSEGAIADAIRHGYKDLFKQNEYFYALSSDEIRNLLIEVTEKPVDDKVLRLMHSTLVNLLTYAKFDETKSEKKDSGSQDKENPKVDLGAGGVSGLPIGLSYTINLNLPATTNIEVFNAIFKSIKENLLEK